VDEATRAAYAAHADEIARRHLRAGLAVARYFAQAFSPGDRILDVGSGTGRDLAALVSEGFTAYGVEPVAEMREQAIRAHPQLAGLLEEGALPGSLAGLAAKLGGPFDGVVCSAVLQHLPRAELFDAVFTLRDLLRPRGRLLVSIPVDRPGVDPTGRDELGRLFTGLRAGELELLCQRVGFRTLGRWDAPDAANRTRWATLLFELEHAGDALSPRPLDRIEAVLQRDRKSSTYKLALLRALTEIATTQARVVRWRLDGAVGVPVEAIADLWLEYYWQLFESRRFLPQAGGEAASGARKLAFAKQLDALRAHFGGAGGLPAFLSSYRQGSLDGASSKLLGRLLARLRATIRDMPVKHAGVSTTGALFGFEDGCVLVSGELWQEIVLMSHWVRDSLLVRWAELIERFAEAAGRAGGVREHALGVLLEPALDERQTRHARRVYEAMPDRRCVWSGGTLARSFEVDHIIPFALWHNNDLWNLVPAAKSVNHQKRDSLPTRRLLRHRRPIILDCWQHLAEALPRQFETELVHLTGSRTPDFQAGYEALTEAVETTALQRGARRWDG
jgi:SAM-dependent methyltransferase